MYHEDPHTREQTGLENMYKKTAPWIGQKTSTNETVHRIVNEKVANAEILMI
jgi:hypothetical protein